MRPTRIQYRDAYYHVMNRGRERRRIFHSDRFYEIFLETLDQATERYNIQVHAFCLMSNHYHLLIKTPEANLDTAMRHINGVFALKHNKLKQTDGPVFRGRYKAIVIDASEYYFSVGRYIHLNPVNVRRPIVECLEDYRWSSYPVYIGAAPPPPWLVVDEIKAAFPEASREYQSYINQGVDEELKKYYAKSKIAPVLGQASFRQQIKDRYIRPHIETAHYERRLVRPTVDQIIRYVATTFDLDEKDVRYTNGRKKNIPRWIAMYLGQQIGGYSLHELTGSFGVSHYTTVSKHIRKLKVALDEDGELNNRVKEMKKDLLSRLVTENVDDGSG